MKPITAILLLLGAILIALLVLLANELFDLELFDGRDSGGAAYEEVRVRYIFIPPPQKGWFDFRWHK